MDSEYAEGALLGLACGDALGRPVEFKPPGKIQAMHGTLTAMVGNGTWGQPAGTITDDTEQALCIARSVVEQGEFDPADISDRFVQWYETSPFDIGNMTRRALKKLKAGQSWDVAGQQVWEESPEGSNAGNGSVMRCPPLAVAYAENYGALARVSRQSSKITHADPRCTYACQALNLTIAGILRDETAPLETALEYLGPDAPEELVTALQPLARRAEIDILSTSGYVIHSLQTVLYDGLTSNGAEEAIITAVNRGRDTDTIGAIAGAVAGARFGASDLPDRWLTEIDEVDELIRVTRQLL